MSARKEAVQPLPDEEAAGSREASQERRLKQINAILTTYKLTPLVQLGTWQRGEFEILDLISVSINPWYAIVQFWVIRPDGQHGSFFMKFAVSGAERRGCAIIVMVEDQLVFVRQHRPTLLVREESAWSTELPREWSSVNSKETIVDRLLKGVSGSSDHAIPLGLLGRELVPLLTSGLVRSECVLPLGSAPEDTGMSTVIVDFWLLCFRLAEGATLEKLHGTKAMGIRTYPLEEVIRRRKELGLSDQHTATALLHLYEHLGRIRA
ncbi:hypothetical protein EPO33_02455 [Patescibacteria group bacterium]|nr:MAG: hypothetical protein EPO33_02455 [Patescibacteria group bacterium]